MRTLTKKPLVKKKRSLENRLNLFTTILLGALVLYVISLMIPLLWAVMTSFKSKEDFRINVIGLPDKWVWNYTTVFRQFTEQVPTSEGTRYVGMGEMFLNAFLYAAGCAFFNTLVPCLTAYVCARFNFKFSKVIYSIVIVTMILPIVGSLPAEIRMAKVFGLYDHIWGQWIMKANFLGMYFLVFYNTFKAMPMAYTEAAKIDGVGNLTIMLRIILPLIRPLFLTVLLINFITFWNDYQIPLVYLPSHPTIALGMYRMITTTENALSSVPMRMTAAMLMLFPILIVFVSFQKQLLGNLTVGGIKG